MKHLFIIDPLECLQLDADTTIAFMREADSRGHELSTCQIETMGVRDGGRPFARAVRTRLEEGPSWYRTDGVPTAVFLDTFDVVWMRKDPPFDMRFFYATHLLSLVARSTLVVNDPLALRDANEKLIVFRFPEVCPQSMVSSSIADLLTFRDELGGEMIVKPLDGAGGEGIFHITPGDRNTNAILEAGKLGMDMKRFKGLGEMDAEQLWETTMDPENRVLLRVTWDAASDAEKLFSILMGEEVEPRRKYIEEHALEVKNLDV